MDNAMVKRGIGAIVLAVIAALLLGYLLNDKSRDRQDIVDMKLPGAPEINIPSLTGSSDITTDNTQDTTGGAAMIIESDDKAKDLTNSVVASATGAAKQLNDASSKVIESTTNPAASGDSSTINTNPGFSFRPPKQNEEKLLVENSGASDTKASSNSASIESAPAAVIASSTTPEPKKASSFKPTIEKEKKQVAKAPNKAAKKKLVEVTKSTTPKKQVEPVAAATSTTSGKYSIQLLATSSESRANKLSKTMTSEGYSSFITKTSSNNKILYRVRVGGHKSRNSAIKAQEGMKRRYQKNFFVQNSLVVSN